MNVRSDDVYKMCMLYDSNEDEVKNWYRLNWYTVKRSHEIFHLKGQRGHIQRQVYRHKLWRFAQNHFPELKMYEIPHSISGNSYCNLTKVRTKIANKNKYLDINHNQKETNSYKTKYTVFTKILKFLHINK